MISDHTFEKAKVYLNDLNEEMTILAYIGFTRQYHKLDRQTCAFIRHNFKGSQALVGRQGKRCSVSVDSIQENDFLYKICSFPPSLRPLTQVSDRLKRSLRTRGILRFEVMRPATLTLDNSRDLIYLINLVKCHPSQRL